MRKKIFCSTHFRLTVLLLTLVFFEACKEDDPVPFDATVSGTVIDADTGEPISGVNIELNQGGETIKSTTTNDEGNFSITVQILGEEVFSITASFNGYEIFTFKEFTLTSGNQTEEADISLQPKAKIRGTVRHSVSEMVLENVLVRLSPEDLSASTDEFGVYEFVGLNAGTYNLSYSKNGFETQEQTVQLQAGDDKSNDVSMVALPSVLSIDKEALDFGVTETVLPIVMENTGGDTVVWSIIENIPWASVNPLSGKVTSDPETINVSVDRNGFNPGSYAQTMTISSNGGTKTISLTMTIQGALLQIIPSEISFGTSESEESIQLQRIGQGTLNYDIQSDRTWLSVQPSSGSVANETDFIILNADRTGLDFGNHDARLAFNTDNGSQIVNVTLTIPDPNAPQLTIEPLDVDLGQDVANKILSIQNTGKGNLSWSVSKSSPWLSISDSGGDILSGETSNVTLTANRSSLTPGNYDDVLRFTSNGGNVNVPVEMEVANKPVLSIDENNLDFGRDLTTKAFVISNIGNGTMTWSVSTNQNWITINPTAGANTGTVNVTILRDGLSFGNYSGQVDIESDGGVAKVIVEMKVLPPNVPPTADFTVSQEVVDLNQEINLDASMSSDDTDVLSQLEVRWKYEISGSFTEWSNDKLSSISYATQGIKTITLEVRDSEGAVGTDSKEVNVIQNQAPNAVFSVNPNSGKAGETTFTVDATGTNDDIDSFDDLQFRWRWEEGQSFTVWTREKTLNHVYGMVGTKTITLEVLDSFGEIGTTFLTVEVTQDITEVEGNDTFTAANDLPFDTQLTGTVEAAGDTDWFKLRPTVNGIAKFTTQNISSGSGDDDYLDPAYIYSSGLEVITSYSNVGGAIPRITNAAISSSGNVIVSKDEVYYVRLRAFRTTGSAPYIQVATMEEIGQSDSGESNQTTNEATMLTLGESSLATVGFGGDAVDWYMVIPTTNGTIKLTVENLQGDAINGCLDQAIVYNSDLVVLSSATDGSSDGKIPPGSTHFSSDVTVVGGETYLIRCSPNTDLDATNYRIHVDFE